MATHPAQSSPKCFGDGVAASYLFPGVRYKKVLSRPRPGYRLILVSEMFKFSTGVQLFELRLTSDGKPVLKNSFPMLDLRCGEVQVQDGIHPIIHSSKS